MGDAGWVRSALNHPLVIPEVVDARTFTAEGDTYQVNSCTTLISETMVMHLEARKLVHRNLPAATLE